MQTNLDDRYIKNKLNNIESILAIILSNQNQNESEITMLFSEYKDAVDSTLAQVLTIVASETDQIKAAIAAAGSEANSPAIQAAFTELNAKRATVVEALGGLISSTPVPTPPVVVPVDPGQPLPLPVVPPTEPPLAPPVVDPNAPPVAAPVAAPVEVPITSTPSQPGVGLPNGVDLSGTPVPTVAPVAPVAPTP